MAASNTLVLVTVLFRHGDRTPDIQNTFPLSPFKGHSFFPYKLGELTHKGQAHMIKLGSDLRERYNSFLGDDYYTDIVSSTSSSYTRCQMSLQCVHAGLFPPNEKSASFTSLPWQAVPYSVIPFEFDKFISIHMRCPEIMDNISPSEIPNEDLKVLKYICEHAGYEKKEYIYAMRLYDFFKTAIEAGLELPDWLLAIWPTQLKKLALKFWHYFHIKRRKFGAGPLIKRIINEARLKTIEGPVPLGKKMYLYAVHDMNLHLLRGALNIWNEEVIEYGAYLIFELHIIDNIYGFKIYFQNGYEEPKLMTIPDYGDYIELDTFEAMTKDLYENEVDCAHLEALT